MRFSCSRCHHRFEADADPEHCPRCRAEAGLERQHDPPPPMLGFAVLLASCVLAALVGSIWMAVA